MKTKKIKGKYRKEAEDISEIIDFKKVNMGYVWVAILILIIIVALFLGIKYAKNSSNFVYDGITFNKTYSGKILFYTATLPTIDNSGRIVGYTQIDLRSDPRQLENVPLSTLNGIGFIKNKTVYISYADLKICSDNGIAAINLGGFLKSFGLDRVGARDNETFQNNTSIPYVNCNTNPDNTVILIKNGETTEVKQTAKNCYELISKDCDIIKATERFELEVMKQYMSSFR